MAVSLGPVPAANIVRPPGLSTRFCAPFDGRTIRVTGGVPVAPSRLDLASVVGAMVYDASDSRAANAGSVARRRSAVIATWRDMARSRSWSAALRFQKA